MNVKTYMKEKWQVFVFICFRWPFPPTVLNAAYSDNENKMGKFRTAKIWIFTPQRIKLMFIE